MKTLSEKEFEKLYGTTGLNAINNASKVKGTLLNPLNESLQGLKTLYGGGEQGIANKLKTNITEAAKDIETGTEQGGIRGVGTAVKGIAKAGLRTAGDVAGTIYAPIGAAIGATGVNKVFDKVGESFVSSKLGNAITDMPKVQQFATERPNAGEDFGRLLNLAFAKAEKGKIEPSTIVSRTEKQFTLPKVNLPKINPEGKTVEQLRAEKITRGYEEQNARLKSADKSFNKNTKVYKDPNGQTIKVTPIDTFAKNNITPIVEKGTINMGDYKNSTGALGKIREKVNEIDAKLDTAISDGPGVPLNEFKNNAIERIKNDTTLKEQGKVASTINKLENVFEDYRQSYGDTLTETQINNIRKTMNQDWNPETVDVSKIIGDTARKTVYDATPNGEAKALLREQGELLAAKKYAETINGTKVTGGRLGNYVMRTGGAIIGAGVQGVPILGPILGMLGGEGLARLMQQSQFKSLPLEAQQAIKDAYSKFKRKK